MQVPKRKVDFLKEKKKKAHLLVIHNKDRLVYFYEEREAKSYQELVPCSNAGYLRNVYCMANLKSFLHSSAEI
jgi:hypothetical protein